MTGDELIAKYAVPDKPPLDSWPMSENDLRVQNAKLAVAVAELKCQRNDLLMDIYKAEAAAERYRRYFVVSFGSLMVAAMAGIGVFLWRA